MIGDQTTSFTALLEKKTYSITTLEYVILRILMQVAYSENRRIEVTHDHEENEHILAPDGIGDLE